MEILIGRVGDIQDKTAFCVPLLSLISDCILILLCNLYIIKNISPAVETKNEMEMDLLSNLVWVFYCGSSL